MLPGYLEFVIDKESPFSRSSYQVKSIIQSIYMRYMALLKSVYLSQENWDDALRDEIDQELNLHDTPFSQFILQDNFDQVVNKLRQREGSGYHLINQIKLQVLSELPDTAHSIEFPQRRP